MQGPPKDAGASQEGWGVSEEGKGDKLMLGRRLNDLLAVIARDGQAPSDMTKDEAKHLRDEGLVELPPDQSQIFDIKAGVEAVF